jgi:hypothetical protein
MERCPASPTRRGRREIAWALAIALALAVAAPLVTHFEHEESGRCCTRSRCCCATESTRSDVCLRSACRCGGHGGDEVRLVLLDPAVLAPAFAFPAIAPDAARFAGPQLRAADALLEGDTPPPRFPTLSV